MRISRAANTPCSVLKTPLDRAPDQFGLCESATGIADEVFLWSRDLSQNRVHSAHWPVCNATIHAIAPGNFLDWSMTNKWCPPPTFLVGSQKHMEEGVGWTRKFLRRVSRSDLRLSGSDWHDFSLVKSP